MKKNSIGMYDDVQRGASYDNTTSFPKQSDYDMYSDNEEEHSECDKDHIHVGPLIIEVCHHEEGSHVCVYNAEDGEMIAETEVSDHPVEHHFQSIAEGMDDIHKAHAEHMSRIQKSDKPFHGYSEKKHSKEGGLNDSYRKKYNRETGSNLKRPVTGKVKPGSKAAKRRKSFCARMSGTKGPTSKDGKLTPKGAALKRWRCSKSEEMNKSEQLRQFMTKVENKRQKLEHYSQKTGLKTIDPKHIGSGIGSKQERNTGHQYSFYYRPDAIKEDLVTNSAKSKYIVDLPEEASLYDLSADPMGFRAKVREENQGAFNPDMLHDKIKEAGFHGFHSPNHEREEMRGVVALYHSQPVSEEYEVWRKSWK